MKEKRKSAAECFIGMEASMDKFGIKVKEKKKMGKPPIPIEQLLLSKSVRMRKDQWDKVDKLGGHKWLRKEVDEAKLPRNWRKKVDQAKVKS